MSGIVEMLGGKEEKEAKNSTVSKSILQFEDKILFSDKQKLKECVARRSTLQRM